MEFGKSDWQTFERGIEKEWLLTNGIGGFASSTLTGVNSRRYHGLLVASLNPPIERHLILSKIDESININGREFELFSYKTPDDIKEGYKYLQRFIMDPLPVYTYCVEDVLLEKEITMVNGENTVAVVYHILNGEAKSVLRFTPLVNFRDYHGNSSRWHMSFEQKTADRETVIKPYGLSTEIRLMCSEGRFKRLEDNWFYNMQYPVEQERGLHSTEDHFIPGCFEIEVGPGEEKYITILATIEKNPSETDGLKLIKMEKDRIGGLLERAGFKDSLSQKLVIAADNFIVRRKSTDSKTIIAGYPWFTDWGRDTMIALPGLTLATGRFQDAKDILYTFSRYVKDGLIPNMFPDAGNEPPYNSVDASLWYFEAVYKYLKYTGDVDFISREIYPKLKEIVEFYAKGTHFKIRMDEDFLISAGDKDTQLTWMDAKVDDWVVTPRHGKAVEINALWYNALKIMEQLAGRFREDIPFYGETAVKVQESFVKSFWNEKKGCLFDVITDSGCDERVRPNQIMAVSLDFPVIEGEKARKIVDRVWKELYTAYGLRSLSPDENEYCGIYTGDRYSRDGAYHQGTVWAWPAGQFFSAYIKAYGNSKRSREIVKKLISPYKDHLRDGCVGSISEIFDGNNPHIPRGCCAQAWSVAEILRAYTEDVGIHDEE